jgi:hypothetical protein
MYQKKNKHQKNCGPHTNPSWSLFFLLCFTMPRGRYVDCLRQFFLFRPRDFDGQFREQPPGAFTNYLDENRKPLPMIAHQTPPFSCLPPLDNLRSAL